MQICCLDIEDLHWQNSVSIFIRSSHLGLDNDGCLLKPQSHLADLASQLTPAENIGSTFEYSECV